MLIAIVDEQIARWKQAHPGEEVILKSITFFRTFCVDHMVVVEKWGRWVPRVAGSWGGAQLVGGWRVGGGWAADFGRGHRPSQQWWVWTDLRWVTAEVACSPTLGDVHTCKLVITTCHHHKPLLPPTPTPALHARRFPHRNKLLGRQNTPEEEAGLKDGSIPAW